MLRGSRFNWCRAGMCVSLCVFFCRQPFDVKGLLTEGVYTCVFWTAAITVSCVVFKVFGVIRDWSLQNITHCVFVFENVKPLHC